MIVETTSLILNLYLRKPTSAPTSIPTTIPISMTSGFAITAVISEYPTVTVATKPAASICPDTPMLNSPAFCATATDKAANIIGVSMFRKLIKSVSIP